MLIEPTLDSLNRFKLHGMAAALSEQLTQSTAHTLLFEERLGLLVDRELSYRDNRRLTVCCSWLSSNNVPAWKISTCVRAADWIAHNWPASPPVTGSAPLTI